VRHIGHGTVCGGSEFCGLISWRNGSWDSELFVELRSSCGLVFATLAQQQAGLDIRNLVHSGCHVSADKCVH
jgi:hypothetical protein